MENTKALMQVVDNPAIDQIAETLSKAVRGAYEAAGPVTIKATVADYVQRDQLTLIPFSVITLFVVLLIGFRTPQGVVADLRARSRS